MSIEHDIEQIRTIQRAEKTAGRSYIIGLPTPEEIPTKGSQLTINELRSHHSDLSRKIEFTPTAKDYQFSVLKCSTNAKDKKGMAEAFRIVAKRDLGDGIIETITTEHEWDREPWSRE